MTLPLKSPSGKDHEMCMYSCTSSNYKAFVGNRVSEIQTIIINLETALGAGTVS